MPVHFEGVPWHFNMILFAGGRRYTGRLLTFEEFLASTEWVLRMVAEGLAPAGTATPESGPEVACLHLAVSEIQDGKVVFSFEGLNLRFPLSHIEAWTTGAIEQ